MTGPAERVETEFAETFGGKPDGRWWAPGRVNLIGEHTDYNDGFVLPLALEFGVAAAARVAEQPVLRVRSVQKAETVELPLAAIAPGAVDGWSAYVSGVGWALREAGHDVPGLDVVVDGDIPVGAGLSSSAALECAVAVAWNDLGGLDLSLDALAAAARRAENDVVGAPTGVMDQMASLYGQDGNLVFIDTRSLSVEPVPFDPPSAGLALLVIDSRAPHALVDGEYAERRRSCEQAVEILGVRVLDVVGALRSGADPRVIGPALTASHASMRDDFEITVPEIDTAVAAALEAGAHGARMTGGGFGGCVLALVEADAVEPVVRAVEAAYEKAGFRAPSTFVATASDGARK